MRAFASICKNLFASCWKLLRKPKEQLPAVPAKGRSVIIGECGIKALRELAFSGQRVSRHREVLPSFMGPRGVGLISSLPGALHNRGASQDGPITNPMKASRHRRRRLKRGDQMSVSASLASERSERSCAPPQRGPIALRDANWRVLPTPQTSGGSIRRLAKCRDKTFFQEPQLPKP